jgi:hypothetical protein
MTEKIAKIILRTFVFFILIWIVSIQIKKIILTHNGKITKARIVKYVRNYKAGTTYIYLYSLDNTIYNGKFGNPFNSNIKVGDSLTILYLEKYPNINYPIYLVPLFKNDKKYEHEFIK